MCVRHRHGDFIISDTHFNPPTGMKTEDLLKALSDIHPLTDEFRKALQKELTYTSFPKNHFLLEANAVSDRIYFLQAGFAMSFYYHKGRKVTSGFWKPGDIILSPRSFFQQTATSILIQLMEDSELFYLSFESMTRLFEKFTVANKLMRAITSQYHLASEQKIFDLHNLLAWDRYQKLLVDFPGIEQHVSQDAISSYLSVTPQSLSRLKAKKK
jgi:CRP/FNR family transcriptional regulator, anaerobic regulatory protein